MSQEDSKTKGFNALNFGPNLPENYDKNKRTLKITKKGFVANKQKLSELKFLAQKKIS